LSNGDKILSENYLQHADHFTRVLKEKENFRREKFLENSSENNSPEDVVINTDENIKKRDLTNDSEDGNSEKLSLKTQVEVN